MQLSTVPVKAVQPGTIMGSSDMDHDGHSLMLPIQHLLCWPQCRPPFKMPDRMLLERLSCRVTCPNHVSFRLLTVARGGFLWTHKEADLAPVTDFVLQVGDVEKIPQALGLESMDPLLGVIEQGPCLKDTCLFETCFVQ